MKRRSLLALVVTLVLAACAPLQAGGDPGGGRLTITEDAGFSVVELHAGTQDALPVEGRPIRIFGTDLAVNPQASCTAVARHLECPFSRLSAREVYRLPVRGKIVVVTAWIARPDGRQHPITYP